MFRIVLATKRGWSWKVFLVLVGLIVPAVFAILPFSLHILNTNSDIGMQALDWRLILRNAILNGLITILLGGIGLRIANRIGIGLPFVESWIKREKLASRFRTAIAISWITAVGFITLILLFQNLVFGPPMQALFEEIGYSVPEGAAAPPGYGLLAAFSAGITEETIFRLFGLSLLAWLGGFLSHTPDGRPSRAVFWTANLIFALAFGLGHLPAAASMGWPINTLIVTRTLVLNGIGGLVLGWLFWMFGLETAILAHFFGDVIMYTLLPIIGLQQTETARIVTLIIMVIVVLLALIWAGCILVNEKVRSRKQRVTHPDKTHIQPIQSVNPSPDTPAVCIQGLTKTFDSQVAVKDLTLEIPQGTIFGFLGPNGAGKTTTLRLLLGLLEPTSGKAQVLGFDTQTQSDQVRARTGALLEYTGIYEQMSAEDNLEFYARAFRMTKTERKARIQELLTQMGLWERRNDRAGTWSRGMKQKLALARTLLHRPKMIFLDEPTAGLDVQAAVAIREDLGALASQENVTLFLTTHNMVDAEKLCHQVAVIAAGGLVAQGTPDELKHRLSTPGVEIKGRGFTGEALALLKSIPSVAAIESRNSHILVNLYSETDVAALVSILVGAGVQIEEVNRTHPSLEEVFLTLTGESDG